MKIFYNLNETIPPKKRAVALGFFDGVHLGHAAVLKKAVSYSDSGLEPCAFTFSMGREVRPDGKKNSLSIQTEEEKTKCMGNLGIEEIFCPDFSSFMNLTPMKFAEDILINKFNAKVLCCGSDFRFGKKAAGNIDFLKLICEKHGVKLEIVPEVYFEDEPVSSTRIRKAVSQGDVKKAGEMLGRYYSISSEVIHGKQLGRKIGFPTINQRLPADGVIPKFGVYSTMITMPDGKVFCGTTNVGVKPTVGSEEILAESYITDFSEDIYGKIVKTEFVEFLRSEEKFESVDLLSRAIERDSKKSLEIFKKSYRKEGI